MTKLQANLVVHNMQSRLTVKRTNCSHPGKKKRKECWKKASLRTNALSSVSAKRPSRPHNLFRRRNVFSLRPFQIRVHDRFRDHGALFLNPFASEKVVELLDPVVFWGPQNIFIARVTHFQMSQLISLMLQWRLNLGHRVIESRKPCLSSMFQVSIKSANFKLDWPPDRAVTVGIKQLIFVDKESTWFAATMQSLREQIKIIYGANTRQYKCALAHWFPWYNSVPKTQESLSTD